MRRQTMIRPKRFGRLSLWICITTLRVRWKAEGPAVRSEVGAPCILLAVALLLQKEMNIVTFALREAAG